MTAKALFRSEGAGFMNERDFNRFSPTPAFARGGVGHIKETSTCPPVSCAFLLATPPPRSASSFELRLRPACELKDGVGVMHLPVRRLEEHHA